MIKNKIKDYWKESEGIIENKKEAGKEHTSQFYKGEPAILLTMITSMVNTLVYRKAFTEEELLEAVKLGAMIQDESK